MLVQWRVVVWVAFVVLIRSRQNSFGTFLKTHWKKCFFVIFQLRTQSWCFVPLLYSALGKVPPHLATGATSTVDQIETFGVNQGYQGMMLSGMISERNSPGF